MAVVVVGGQARKVGKTTLVIAIIQAMPARRWTAMKITRCHHPGPVCHCHLNGAEFAVSQERQSGPGSDSARYLAAGAEKAFWVRALPEKLDLALPAIRSKLQESRAAGLDIIVESNSLVEHLSPDVFLCVADSDASEKTKSNWQQALKRADALVVKAGDRTSPKELPRFITTQGIPLPGDLLRFLDAKLALNGP